MARVLLTIVLPLLLPTAIYAGWLLVMQRTMAHAEPVRWSTLPWVWLAAAGVLLLAAVLVTVTVHFGEPASGRYVPPRYENGRIVPPHIETEPRKEPRSEPVQTR